MERMSDKYDFSNPNVRNEYVTEMGCSVGGCISIISVRHIIETIVITGCTKTNPDNIMASSSELIET